MSFREKSAWVQVAALIAGGAWYFRTVLHAWSETGQLVSPAIPLILYLTGLLVVFAVVSHVVIAALNPAEVDEPVDERESRIFDRAGHYSFYVLAFGIVGALAGYVFLGDGDLLFYTVFASLFLAQIAEYLLQIFYYRTSV